MNRTIGYVLALVVLIGLGFAIYTYAPKASPLSTANITETESDGTDTNVGVVYGESDTYRIEVHYPQFGVPLVDAKIQTVVDNAVAAFKSYPANPADSSLPKNEFTGSFNSTYVGADVVSVALSFSEYTGGAHPNTVIIGVNVDPKTGVELTLDDALGMIGKTLPEVSSESLVQLKAKIGDELIFPEGAEPKPENYSTFLVSADKVTFIFNSYQVAPYASGQQSVEFARVK
jgi:hypothetical protein